MIFAINRLKFHDIVKSKQRATLNKYAQRFFLSLMHVLMTIVLGLNFFESRLNSTHNKFKTDIAEKRSVGIEIISIDL